MQFRINQTQKSEWKFEIFYTKLHTRSSLVVLKCYYIYICDEGGYVRYRIWLRIYLDYSVAHIKFSEILDSNRSIFNE